MTKHLHCVYCGAEPLPCDILLVIASCDCMAPLGSSIVVYDWYFRCQELLGRACIENGIETIGELNENL